MYKGSRGDLYPTRQPRHKTSWGGSDKKETEAGWDLGVPNREGKTTGVGLDLGPTRGRLGLFPESYGNKCLDRTLATGAPHKLAFSLVL